MSPGLSSALAIHSTAPMNSSFTVIHFCYSTLKSLVTYPPRFKGSRDLGPTTRDKQIAFQEFQFEIYAVDTPLTMWDAVSHVPSSSQGKQWLCTLQSWDPFFLHAQRSGQMGMWTNHGKSAWSKVIPDNPSPTESLIYCTKNTTPSLYLPPSPSHLVVTPLTLRF